MKWFSSVIWGIVSLLTHSFRVQPFCSKKGYDQIIPMNIVVFKNVIKLYYNSSWQCIVRLLHFIHKHTHIQIYIYIYIYWIFHTFKTLITQWGHERVRRSTWQHFTIKKFNEDLNAFFRICLFIYTNSLGNRKLLHKMPF